jgi:6-phosphogluconate dehydrogenase
LRAAGARATIARVRPSRKEAFMDIGFVGLGRMGLNMTIRLQRAGHRVVGWDRNAEPVAEAKAHGAEGVATLAALPGALRSPRAIWAMIPAGKPVDDLIETLAPRLERGDLIVDGGNSNYQDSVRRGAALKGKASISWMPGSPVASGGSRTAIA